MNDDEFPRKTSIAAYIDLSLITDAPLVRLAADVLFEVY